MATMWRAPLSSLSKNCFPGQIEVQASSAAPSEGGIGAGSDWLHWIHNQVRGSKFTAVILTPNSVRKPWLMWEAGAVAAFRWQHKRFPPLSLWFIACRWNRCPVYYDRVKRLAEKIANPSKGYLKLSRSQLGCPKGQSAKSSNCLSPLP